jgi:hypothetical protein
LLFIIFHLFSAPTSERSEQSYQEINIDGPVKRIFSPKNAKNTKKIFFNISILTLRALIPLPALFNSEGQRSVFTQGSSRRWYWGAFA